MTARMPVRNPRVPKMARTGKHAHDPRTCAVCRANAKQPQPRRRTEGYPVGGRGARSHPQGWFPPRDLAPESPAGRPHNPAHDYAPSGKHRGRGTAQDTGYQGRHRTYEGRHRAYDAKHRAQQ